jgi:hypothetical protein
VIDPDSLRALDDAVVKALASGDDSALDVLGYGEITVVVGWPRGRHELACKRLPPFPDGEALERYRQVQQRYLAVLARAGITVEPTDLHAVAGPGGRLHAYCVQPALPADALGPAVLRRADPAKGHPMVGAIVDAVARVVDARTGLDAQLSNWAWVDDSLRYFDVTTPFLRDADEHVLLDLDVFLASLPWVLRAPSRRFVFPGVIARFHDPRSVVVDLAGNLHKERLDAWVAAFLAAANPLLEHPIDPDEPRRYYRSDARLWQAMQAVRRADRWWQRRVRRRGYDFLLPGRIER